jgi:hypothetical protein
MNIPSTLSVLTCVSILAGCQNHVLLTNHTVLGADLTAADGANGVIGFKRSELATVPKKADGSTHSTVMSLDNAYDFGTKYCINQTIATGAAADAAAEALSSQKNADLKKHNKAVGLEKNKDGNTSSDSPLVFSTYTSWGLADINLTTSGPQNNISLIHYKRSEGAIIPVEDNESIRPIYGKFYLDDQQGQETKHQQIMATGSAAIAYAGAYNNWNPSKKGVTCR